MGPEWPDLDRTFRYLSTVPRTARSLHGSGLHDPPLSSVRLPSGNCQAAPRSESASVCAARTLPLLRSREPPPRGSSFLPRGPGPLRALISSRSGGKLAAAALLNWTHSFLWDAIPGPLRPTMSFTTGGPMFASQTSHAALWPTLSWIYSCVTTSALKASCTGGCTACGGGGCTAGST